MFVDQPLHGGVHDRLGVVDLVGARIMDRLLLQFAGAEDGGVELFRQRPQHVALQQRAVVRVSAEREAELFDVVIGHATDVQLRLAVPEGSRAADDARVLDPDGRERMLGHGAANADGNGAVGDQLEKPACRFVDEYLGVVGRLHADAEGDQWHVGLFEDVRDRIPLAVHVDVVRAAQEDVVELVDLLDMGRRLLGMSVA